MNRPLPMCRGTMSRRVSAPRYARKVGAPRVASETPESDDFRERKLTIGSRSLLSGVCGSQRAGGRSPDRNRGSRPNGCQSHGASDQSAGSGSRNHKELTQLQSADRLRSGAKPLAPAHPQRSPDRRLHSTKPARGLAHARSSRTKREHSPRRVSRPVLRRGCRANRGSVRGVYDDSRYAPELS